MKRNILQTGIAALLFLTSAGLLYGQDISLEDRFDYKGDMYMQGFYLNRDLPLVRPDELKRTNALGEAVEFPHEHICSMPEYYAREVDAAAGSRCREEEDYYQTRLRLKMAFRPSMYADILYGVEVGYLTWGRESDTYGPGSGGKGTGRTNLETQNLVFLLHNSNNTASVGTGIFWYSAPRGLVFANSGAGAKFDVSVPSISSRFDGVWFKAEDNSRIDDDSNGFSDDNFQDVDVGMVKWKMDWFEDIRPELYVVYRRDKRIDATDRYETSRLFWAGLYITYTGGPFKIMFHAVGNGGQFERPETLDEMPVYQRMLVSHALTKRNLEYSYEDPPRELENVFALIRWDDGSAPEYGTLSDDVYYKELPRKRQNVAAGAGEMEFSYRVSDFVSVNALFAGGSGRLGLEPDGSLNDYRTDQFRTAGSSYQLTDITVDVSGGYSIFSGGQLTGINVSGASVDWNIVESLKFELGYYYIQLNHPPVMMYNTFYTKYPFYIRQSLDEEGHLTLEEDYETAFVGHPGVRSEDLKLGTELNLRMTWRVWPGFTMKSRLAWFNAGDGYRAWKDVEYGEDIYEFAVSINQEI